MYKSKEFDYDLWTTTQNGTKHYWARVKATGEVTEISHEVMTFLRAEEKRVYREITAIKKHGSTLSLDVPRGEDKESWFEDHGIGMSEMEIALIEQDFRILLTEEQLDVYVHCILDGETATSYGKRHGKTQQAVTDTIAHIREKAKKYFSGDLLFHSKMSVVG